MVTRSRIVVATGILALVGGCHYQGTPVPIAGDTQLLSGEWDGTYSSEQTGRSGTIVFSLKAGTDSAFGDVWMIPRRPDYVQNPGGVPEESRSDRMLARPLRIAFVRCAEGEVTGRLDPYEDPETGDRIFTTFEGRLEGKQFKGRFSSLYQPSGMRATGTWSVTRKSPPPPQP